MTAVMACGTANAIDYIGPSSGNWNDSGNWQGGNVPDSAGEVARFTYDATVTLQSARTIGELSLANSGTDVVIIASSTSNTLTLNNGSSQSGQVIVPSATTLTLDDRSTLILQTNGTPVSHLIDGSLILASAANTQPTVRVEADMAFSYNSSPGFITGQDANARIQIKIGSGGADDTALTNFVTMRGVMQFVADATSGSGTATMNNEGVVDADGNGILKLNTGLQLSDVGGAEWRSSGSTSVLLFDEDADLDGDVFLTVDCGARIRLSANVQVDANGDFHFEFGAVDVQASGSSFSVVDPFPISYEDDLYFGSEC